MASTRKHRGDSKLKTLKEPVQAAIIEQMKAGKIQDVIKWIRAECCISTSVGALSEFWSWWHLRERMRQQEQRSVDLQAMLRERRTGLSEEEIIAIGNQFFMEQGVALGDGKLFAAILDRVLAKRTGETRARQKDAELQIKQRRLTLLEQKAAQADRTRETLQDAKLTMEQKQSRLKEVYGL